MTKRKKRKTWAGNRPSIRENWQLAHFVECDEGQWEVYTRPGLNNLSWVNIKVVACGRAELKANYWLAWSRDDQRFAENNDLPTLQNSRPILFGRIRQLVERLPA